MPRSLQIEIIKLGHLEELRVQFWRTNCKAIKFESELNLHKELTIDQVRLQLSELPPELVGQI